MGIEASHNRIESKEKSSSSSSRSPASSTIESSLDIQIKDLETFTLVWLDSDIDEEDPSGTLRKSLREQFTSLLTFNDLKSCEEWFKGRSTYEKILLIVSGEFGKRITLNIHQLPSIVYIYIYCWQPELYLEWTSNYPKVRAVYSESQILIEKITKDRIDLENIESSKSIEIFANRLNSLIIDSEMTSFIFYQLFLEILLSPSYLPLTSSSSELSNILRQFSSNDQQYFNLIKQFELTYNKENSIEWLTKTTPFARLINKSLREENVSMLFYLRFFLIDIFNQLKSNQLPSTHVYRKQLMSNTQIENIQNNLNNYLTFREFVYTSREPPEFSSNEINDKEYQTVVIEIEAQYEDGSSPFAYLNKNVNNSSDIILMCGSIFEIISLKENLNSSWILQLSLVTNRKFDILKEKKEKLKRSSDLLIIVELLDQLHQSEKMNIYSQQLLKELPKSHPLINKIKQQLNINTNIEPVSLTQFQFLLIDLERFLSPLSLTMLNSLQSLTNNSIVYYENCSSIDWNRKLNETIFIFTTSEVYSLIEKDILQSTKVFILGNNPNPNSIDQIRYFSNSEDLFFELADELYRCYIEEDKKNCSDTSKKTIAEQIHIELKNIYRTLPSNANQNQSTTIIWLKFDNNNDQIIGYIKDIFENVISSFLIVNNENDCYTHLCTTEYQNSIFLIIDDQYKENSLLGLKQMNNIKETYRFIPSLKNEYFIRKLILDLINHYNQLEQTNHSKEYFLKSHQLCQILLEL